MLVDHQNIVLQPKNGHIVDDTKYNYGNRRINTTKVGGEISGDSGNHH